MTKADKKLTWKDAPVTLTVTQAAELVNCHRNSITNWIHAGKLYGRKTPGGHWRVFKADLARIMQGKRKEV